MPFFTVLVREVHVSHRQIEAKTAEEALRLYVEGVDDGDEIYLEYSHTLDPETFTVEGPFDEDGNEIGRPNLKVVRG
jgi:hypothetical protein